MRAGRGADTNIKKIFLGKIAAFDGAGKTAEVRLEGILCVGNWIEVRPIERTPGWIQQVVRMTRDGHPAAKAFAGDTIRLGLQQPAEAGDEIYRLDQGFSDPPEPQHPTPDDGEKPSRPISGKGKPQPIGQGSEQEGLDLGDLLDMIDLPSPDDFPDETDGRSKDKDHGAGG